MASKKYLRRYTNLASCIDLLQRKELTLLRPSTWDDRNDVEYMKMYCERVNASAIYALCFTEAVETYHHWKIFSHDMHGVCIYFEKANFIASIKCKADVEIRKVNYPSLKSHIANGVRDCDMPFTKQYAYRAEEEMRIVAYSHEKKASPSMRLSFDVGLIAKIQLSPWLPDPLIESIEHVLRDSAGAYSFEVKKSNVVDNFDWKVQGLI